MTITTFFAKNRNDKDRKLILPNQSTTIKTTIHESVGFEKVLFNKYLTNLIHCPISVKGSYLIPETVISIGIEAFAQCKGLTSILIPSSVKTIGCLAFSNCTGLTSIFMSESVTEIGYGVFSNCRGLKSIYLQAKAPFRLNPDADVFHNVDKASCILHVPAGSKKAYQYTDCWKEFKNIQEIDEDAVYKSHNFNLENS